MRKRPVAYAACVFLTGLVYQRYQAKILVVVLLLLIGWEIWSGRKTKKILKIAGRSLILLSAFLLGIYHMQSEEVFRQAYMSKVEDGSRITVWGELIKTESTEYGIRGTLSDCYISLEEKKIPCNDIMVYFSSDCFKTGQFHKITGQVETFSEARNTGNFNQRVYYQSLKIDFSVQEEECLVLSKNENQWRNGLYSFRDSIGAIYGSSMEEKAAGFYQAMVLGNKSNLDESLKELFTLGGISHILAISGLHVSILGRGLYKLLRGSGAGFGIAGCCASVLLVNYCIMVGNSTSTVRAVGMMLLFFLAQWIGRSYDMLNALGFMVMFLLWENVFLIENTGFWFSVTALLGVGIVGKELSSCVKRGKGFWMSVGITLTTLPVTACSYYEIPVYSPVVNFIVLPLLTPVFCLALIGGVLGLWFPGLDRMILKPCEWLLFFYEWVCNMVEGLPGANVICGMPSLGQVILYYLLLLIGVGLLRYISRNKKKMSEEKTKQEQKGGLGIVFVLCFFCFCVISFPKEKPFEITFLDVGQGDGIYISSGDGSTFFIDGGSTNVNEVGEYRILPFLKAKGIRSIDYWFVSHCDTDHISGLLEVLESGYEIKHLVLAKYSPKDEVYKNLIDAAREVQTEVLYMDAGHQICSQNLKITCLAPSGEQVVKDDRNESSLILELKWMDEARTQEFKALFAGDISIEAEDKLCQDGLLADVDLYKANHHGSNYSNGILLLETIKPEFIVVSCSENNLYGHPGVQAVERMENIGAEIFYTMERGQITLAMYNDEIEKIQYIREKD